MTTPLLRPRSASEILDAAVRVLRRHYATFLVVSAIGYIPQLLLGVAQLAILGAEGGTVGEDPTFSPFAFGWLAGVGVVLVYVAWYSVTEGVHVSLASSAYNTGRVDVGEAFARAKSRAPKLFASAILATLAMMAGFIALVVPGFYVIGRLGSIFPAAVLDEPDRGGDLPPSEVLRRTWRRTDGRVWHVLATLGLAFVAYMVLSFGAMLLAGALSVLAGPYVVLGVTALITILAYPLIPIVNTVLYYDLRIRAEGYDLEASVESLGAPAGLSAPPVRGGELPPAPARVRIR